MTLEYPFDNLFHLPTLVMHSFLFQSQKYLTRTFFKIKMYLSLVETFSLDKQLLVTNRMLWFLIKVIEKLIRSGLTYINL